MPDDALHEARHLLNELTEAARKGQIIPIRLTGQLEAIQEAFERAQEQQAQAAAAAAAAPSGDIERFTQELAGLLSHGFHDLRLPLTNIRGYADMLGSPAMGTLSDMQAQFVGTVRTNARRMEALLIDVSDIAKLRCGTLKATPKMDMFKNIAMMTEKAMRPLADELQRKFEVDVPQGLPLLNTDGELLAKALNKLVENALRYTRPEDGHVRLSGEAEGKLLHIRVEDNGIGMSPEELGQLGTPYFRADNDLVLSYKGSGLGIPIAFGLIRLLGGSIGAASQPGQGTTFTVTLTGMG